MPIKYTGPDIKRRKTFNGKRYSLDAVRETKSEAQDRAKSMKKYWKNTRVLKSHGEYCIYVRGHKR